VYAHALRLLLTVAFALACEGCFYSEEDMARPIANLEQWGQQKVFAPASWATNQRQVVLQRDAPSQEYSAQHLPQVNTLLLSVENEDSDDAQDYNLRWELVLGVGAVRVPIVFDAVGATRVSVPTEAFTLALFAESFPEPYPQGDLPAGEVRAFAMTAEDGIGHSYAEGATHTTMFQLVTVAGADVFDIPIPRGATAFRIVGKHATGGGVATPFRPQFLVQIMQGTTIIATLVGEGAAVADPSLRTLYYSGLWFPLPGSLTKFQLAMTDFPITCNVGVQFKIDI
jgi:hypothetical protein